MISVSSKSFANQSVLTSSLRRKQNRVCAYASIHGVTFEYGGLQIHYCTQNPDGSWTEDHITGTGFPKVFYLKYDMYRNNWPLLALADFRALAARDRR